jgi:hypothetical protein
VLCGDYLARGFNFYLLQVQVVSYNSPAPSTAVITDVINSYLGQLSPGDNFVMTDMVSLLRLNGITNIQNPPTVTYKKYTRDLTPVEMGTITDILDPNDTTNIFLLDTVASNSSNINPGTLLIA